MVNRMPPPNDSDDLKLRILASVPHSYPESSPPQLQLLNRYIGPYKVDSGLFGSVLRTFMSKDGVEFSADNVCIFDGVENVKERCGRWYEDRLSDKAVAEMQLEDEMEQMKLSTSENHSREGENKSKKYSWLLILLPARPAWRFVMRRAFMESIPGRWAITTAWNC